VQCQAAAELPLDPHLLVAPPSNRGVYPSTLVYACASGFEFDPATLHQNQTWCGRPAMTAAAPY
jgi:hypothetical protein